MSPLRFANGVSRGVAWEKCQLDDHQHPIQVKYKSSLAFLFWFEKEVPTWRARQEIALD
jgi:hypothetical protein